MKADACEGGPTGQPAIVGTTGALASTRRAPYDSRQGIIRAVGPGRRKRQGMVFVCLYLNNLSKTFGDAQSGGDAPIQRRHKPLGPPQLVTLDGQPIIDLDRAATPIRPKTKDPLRLIAVNGRRVAE